MFYIYKPVQQNAGKHDSESWMFHFENMKNDIKELRNHFDFDIALVSCGGFGMLLSDYIYTVLHKSTMYVGGALQLYFGIMGKRWENHTIISKLKNKKWTNVLKEDIPSTLRLHPQLCEYDCYW